MKRVLALFLTFILIFGLASCRDYDAVSSEETSAPAVSSQTTAPTNKFNIYDEIREINKYIDGTEKINLGNLKYNDPYKENGMSMTSHMDFFNDEELRQKHNQFLIDRNNVLQKLSDEELFEYKMKELPPVYTFIREAGITKEQLKSANKEMRDTYYNKGVDEDAWEKVYTDEEIELLFSDDIAGVVKHFSSKYGFYHNGKVYYLKYFCETTHEEWKAEGLPADNIRDVFSRLVSDHTDDLFEKKLISEDLIRSQERQIKALFYKLSQYEKLIEE